MPARLKMTYVKYVTQQSNAAPLGGFTRRPKGKFTVTGTHHKAEQIMTLWI